MVLPEKLTFYSLDIIQSKIKYMFITFSNHHLIVYLLPLLPCDFSFIHIHRKGKHIHIADTIYSL